MKMLRGESGIALLPVFHLGVQHREGLTLSDTCPRDTECTQRTRGIAIFTVAASKIPISRTTRARLYMKHGFSAHPRLAAPNNLIKQFNMLVTFHTKKAKVTGLKLSPGNQASCGTIQYT